MLHNIYIIYCFKYVFNIWLYYLTLSLCKIASNRLHYLNMRRATCIQNKFHGLGANRSCHKENCVSKQMILAFIFFNKIAQELESGTEFAQISECLNCLLPKCFSQTLSYAYGHRPLAYLHPGLLYIYIVNLALLQTPCISVPISFYCGQQSYLYRDLEEAVCWLYKLLLFTSQLDYYVQRVF